MVSSGESAIEMDAVRVTRYFRLRTVPYPLILAVLMFPTVGLLVEGPRLATLMLTSPVWGGLLFYLAYVLWIAPRQARALRYWLQGTTLRIDEGLVFRKLKSIPLDRVTDLALVQGPILRLCGIWTIHVQTAGSVQQRPEGVLYGLCEPQRVRDDLMQVRDRAAKSATDPGN